MQSLTLFFSKTRESNANRDFDSHPVGGTTGGGGGGGAEMPGPEETIAATADGASHETPLPTTSGGRDSNRALMDNPPTDDVCPICFCNFDVPCRAPCGHWYCGRCILQYWNFCAALQPCRCPMCSRSITKLMPEASLYQRHEEEISKILQNVRDYNRLFVGGVSGFMLKFLAIPLSIKRMFREMLNPDRPGVYLNEMRVVALFLGVLYSFFPFDFLQIGHGNIIDVFDYSAFALSFIFYLVGLFLRGRRQRNIRELVDGQAHD